jgi:soluble lytic murein transglycosylase-like protein
MLETLIAILLPILAAVESGNNPNAIGDNSRAVGILQIWPIMVKDVNRISGKAYTLQDRRSKAKSYEMATIYLKHYGKPNAEYLARAWNGGPKGNKKTALPHLQSS